MNSPCRGRLHCPSVTDAEVHIIFRESKALSPASETQSASLASSNSITRNVSPSWLSAFLYCRRCWVVQRRSNALFAFESVQRRVSVAHFSSGMELDGVLGGPASDLRHVIQHPSPPPMMPHPVMPRPFCRSSLPGSGLGAPQRHRSY